jgi:hypothetical protein
MSALERHCRSLLLAYPAWYRRDRGDEMLDTLLAATADGRRWPSVRDARGLVVGGLRVRAGLGVRQPMRVNLRLSVMLAIALLVLIQSGIDLALGISGVRHAIAGGPPAADLLSDGLPIAAGLLALVVVVAAWLGRRVLAVTAAGVSLALSAAGFAITRPVPVELLRLLPAMALPIGLALLARGGQRMPTSWLWLAGPAFAAPALLSVGLPDGFPALYQSLAVLVWAGFGMVLLWMLVDARLALAIALVFIYGRLVTSLMLLVQFGSPLEAWTWYLPVAGALLLASLAAWKIRRQAAL